MSRIKNISIVGSGNIAFHLGNALKNNGIIIDYIYSRNEKEAIKLSKILNSKHALDIKKLENSDLVLLCVPDDVVYNLIDQIPNIDIAYTSGSVELKEINGKNIGVFYPLQSFQKSNEIEIYKVPVFIEATNKILQYELIELANKISVNVSIVHSEERKKYHLSAVFLNNFTNHLIYLAKKEADKNDINWVNLIPLLEETFIKNITSDPFYNQTGPAIRNDIKTIDKHLSLLEGKSKEIYKVLTESIKSTYHD